MDTEKGCLDVNECAAAKSPCKRNQFCVNNEGTYTCLGELGSLLCLIPHVSVGLYWKGIKLIMHKEHSLPSNLI